MATHDLKCWPAEYEAICSGRKRCEVRLNDRGFAVEDVLRLHEWTPTARVANGLIEEGYTGRVTEVLVTHVQDLGEKPVAIAPGWVVMSIV